MAWSKYKNVQYGTVFPGSNLTDFPLLVKIAADSDIASECGSGGGIKFTSADGMTDLAFGLYPSSDITTGDIIARVKASPITSGTTGNPIVRLYYSASESTTEDKAGVMDGNYVLFMPLEEDPSGSAPQMFDWVSETNVGTSAGTMTSGDLVTGQVGNGLELDGSDDYIATPSITIGTAATVECGFCRKSSSTSRQYFLAKDQAGSRVFGFALYESGVPGGENDLVFTYWDGASRSVGAEGLTAVDQWRALAGTAGSGTVRLYVDGTERDTNTIGTLTNVSSPVNIGRRAYSSFEGYTNCIIDEVRLSSTERSADWLAYAYENDFNNSDTVTLGSEQGGGGGGAANVNLLRGKVRGGLLLGGKL